MWLTKKFGNYFLDNVNKTSDLNISEYVNIKLKNKVLNC